MCRLFWLQFLYGRFEPREITQGSFFKPLFVQEVCFFKATLEAFECIITIFNSFSMEVSQKKKTE
jgi:hypothetical protein